MSQTLTFRTNLHCDTCVDAVKPYLDAVPAVSSWEVDVADSAKTLVVRGESVSADAVRDAVTRAGFHVWGDAGASGAEDAPHTAHEHAAATTYYPLILVLGFVLGIACLVEVARGRVDWERAMGNFMGGFFLAFSFFKLLDLRGFAASYQMYDVVAQRFPGYAYVYPFIELLLGAAYVTGFRPVLTNIVTVVVMSISAVGVVQSLLAKRTIRCACLGTVFNLPMSTVTLVEDSLMVVMAAGMLLV